MIAIVLDSRLDRNNDASEIIKAVNQSFSSSIGAAVHDGSLTLWTLKFFKHTKDA